MMVDINITSANMTPVQNGTQCIAGHSTDAVKTEFLSLLNGKVSESDLTMTSDILYQGQTTGLFGEICEEVISDMVQIETEEVQNECTLLESDEAENAAETLENSGIAAENLIFVDFENNDEEMISDSISANSYPLSQNESPDVKYIQSTTEETHYGVTVDESFAGTVPENVQYGKVQSEQTVISASEVMQYDTVQSEQTVVSASEVMQYDAVQNKQFIVSESESAQYSEVQNAQPVSPDVNKAADISSGFNAVGKISYFEEIVQSDKTSVSSDITVDQKYFSDFKSASSAENDISDEVSLNTENTGFAKETAVVDEKAYMSEKGTQSDFEALIQGAVTLNSLDFAGRSSEYILEDVIAQQDVSKQTMEALSAGIKTGKEEFIIKLTPEGLGDITVKFEKTEDTMLVYMVASDEKTSQLLNQELDVLRSMLRPYNAQISEVEFKQENVQREMFLSGDDSGYRAGSQSQENDGHHKRPVFHSGRFVDVLPEESDIQAETIAMISGNVILNRYI